MYRIIILCILYIMSYLRSFVIASSLPVFILWFLRLHQVKDRINIPHGYEMYKVLAPLYFGLMNMISLYLSKKYNWSLRQRLLNISLVSCVFVFTLNKLAKTYTLTTKQWISYGFRLCLGHLITYNIIIHYLEKNV